MVVALGHRARLRQAAAAILVACGGCAADDKEDAEDGDSGMEVERTCIAPQGLGSPTTIEEAVELINALPMPVTIPCFVESLDRPLTAYATSNDFSAQPAEGEHSPRFFIFSGDLITTVVAGGIGQELLEFGYLTGEGRTLKAELEFPVEAPLPLSAPYDTPRIGSGTRCATCHEAETRADFVPHAEAYTSAALQPPPTSRVSLSFAKAHAMDCDLEAEPDRCGMLTAVFAHGEVLSGDFPPGTKICIGG